MKHLLLFLILSNACFAGQINLIEKQTNKSINTLYHKLQNMPTLDMAQRIDWISQQFMGAPYVLGALGEGDKARYDQYPLYRTDTFDCDTYVNTVLSLALSHSLSSFQQCIRKMRYLEGDVSYLKRAHFTGLDWNNAHQKARRLKDITTTVYNEKKQPIALLANASIDKANWYAHKNLTTIRLPNEDENSRKKRLAELQKKGAQLQTKEETVPYLPLDILFQNNQPNLYLFNQIPHGAVIEIVRPHWNLREKIGTNLTISHLGFAIRQDNQLFFRHSSIQYGGVVDTPLIPYLLKALQESPTIKGINVQIVIAKNCV